MSVDGERKIVENVTREVLADALKEGPITLSDKNKLPPGCVERILSFRDRNLIIGACRAWCQKQDRSDQKAITKLDRIQKLLVFEETVEYYEMIDDHYTLKQREWEKQKQLYLDGKGEKHGKRPQPSAQEQRGQERLFHVPSKLDAWIQESLREMRWNPLTAEYVTELFSKFEMAEE